jgi:predicted nucleotidyltransferase
MRNLVEHGLVNREEVGRTFLYELNRDHLLAPIVEQMAGARAELVRRLCDEIDAWEISPVHASLFGSAARGDGDARSDIDLLVVRPAEVDPDDLQWRKQVDELADLVRRWTGNNAGIAEVSEGDLPRLRKDRPPVVEEVSEDAVDLAGEATRKLLRRL